MIKTIDTRNITDIMLEAQNVIDGTTTYSDPLSFKDAADIFIAMAEAAPAVEPAQAAIKCKEPAQAVPFAWVLECMTSIGTTCWMLSWNRSGVGSCNRLHGQDHEKPLYTAPPAIDDETKRMVLEQTNTKAAEPAQAVPAFWASENVFKESLRDNISCILTTTKCAANTVPLYTAPPAIVEAVPVAWLPIETAPKDGTEILVTYGKQGFVMQLVRFDRTFNYWKNKGEAELGLENNATHWMPIPDPRKPLYTAPPAIDDETRKMVLELCELTLINSGPCGMVTAAMKQRAVQIREKLEAG